MWMVMKGVMGMIICWNHSSSMWCRARQQTVVRLHTQQQPGLHKAGSERGLLLPSRALQQHQQQQQALPSQLHFCKLLLPTQQPCSAAEFQGILLALLLGCRCLH
jgi:hypothetical protein